MDDILTYFRLRFAQADGPPSQCDELFGSGPSARIAPGLLLSLGLLLAVGCAREQYRYGVDSATTGFARPTHLATNPVAIGGVRPRVDRLESIIQSPRRLVRRFRKPKDDEATPQQLRQEAVDLTQSYLVANGLEDVYIDVRRYEPGEQWARLRENERIRPVWKYTAGALSVLAYTVIPRRALHSDKYDPFTNTLSINSTKPPKALYQAASAKEYRKHPRLGAYAVLQQAPLAPMVHHARTATDVLTYAKSSGQDELARELYPVAYGQLGGAAVSEVMFFAPLPADVPAITSPLARVAGRVSGAVAGRVAARRQVPENQVR